jgi:hypothetical protein
MGAGAALGAGDPTVSVRANLGPGVDAELHLDKLGLGVAYFPVGAIYDYGFCTDEFSRTFLTGRYFMDWPQNSLYFGVAFYSESAASLGCGVEEANSGILPLIGYHWLLDSGVNLDLGLRPGIFAIGFSF